MDSLILYLVLIAVGVGIFIVFRAVVLWYFKLDEIAQSLASIEKSTATIVRHFEVVNKNTIAIAERIEVVGKKLDKEAETEVS